MTSFVAQLLSSPSEIKAPSSDKRAVGTHMGKLDPDQRARRKIKNVRTKQHQPADGMHMSCRSYKCTHRRHGASKRRPS